MTKPAPKHQAYTHLLPTLFDRLSDDHPHQTSEPAEAFTVTRKKMREIIQRDLAYLLNTTNMDDLMHYPQDEAIRYATTNYGIPPLAGSYLSSHQWRHIERCIRQAIIHFEPRLIPEALHIVPHQHKDSEHHYNILSFEIHGLIHMDPYPMEFLMQSTLDFENNRLSVSQ